MAANNTGRVQLINPSDWEGWDKSFITQAELLQLWKFINPKVKPMNLREEPAEPKLLKFIITIDLPIPPREITASKQ